MRWLTSILLVCCIVGHSGFAKADFVTIGNGFGSKWGDPNFGMPSDIITWTFMDDSTNLHAGHPLLPEVLGGVSATSDITTLRSNFDAVHGAGSFDAIVQSAFETWVAAIPGRIQFQFVPTDTGADAGDSSNPDSYAVDIRIGAFHSVPGSGFSFIGAVGYGPPGDDLNFPDALAGDVIFNLDSNFFIAPGVEDDVFYTGGIYVNDLEGLVLHELGHAAVGLGHSTDGPNFPGLGDVMYVDVFPDCCNFINRQLSQQDIAGARTVYGILLGDVNRDGMVNLLDVDPFITLLSNGDYQEEADVNEDGMVNLLDVDPFIALLSGG